MSEFVRDENGRLTLVPTPKPVDPALRSLIKQWGPVLDRLGGSRAHEDCEYC